MSLHSGKLKEGVEAQQGAGDAGTWQPVQQLVVSLLVGFLHTTPVSLVHKYIHQFGEIHFVIGTSTFENWRNKFFSW